MGMPEVMFDKNGITVVEEGSNLFIYFDSGHFNIDTVKKPISRKQFERLKMGGEEILKVLHEVQR